MNRRFRTGWKAGLWAGRCGIFLHLLTTLAGWSATGDAELDFTKQSLEELMQVKIPTVIAASKHEQKTTEAPAAVSVVTRSDIEHYGYRTLSDILRSVRGVFISSDEIYNYIGVRGVKRPGDYGGRVLVMIDGHRMNEPVFDQAFNGHDLPLDVDLIERVEVVRGTGSSLYGNNAGLGVINIVTRDASSWNGIEASVTGGSYDTFSSRLTYGKVFTNGVSLILSATALDSQGQNSIYYPEFSTINGGQSVGLDGEQAQKYFASLKVGDLTLQACYGDRRRDTPNAAYDTVFNAHPNYSNDERGFAEGRYHHEFDHDWVVTARVYYDYYKFEGKYPYAGAAPGDPNVLNYDTSRAELLGTELQVSKTLWEKHQLTFGTEWNHTLDVSQRNYDIDPAFEYNNIHTDGDNVGLYAQDEFAIFPKLTLSGGVRYDWYSTFGDTVNPRIAAIYTPWTDTTFKAIYGQAFRAPNAYEYEYVAPGYASNYSLEPEEIRTAELVWEQGIARNYRLTVSGFYTELNDLIAQQEDPLTSDLYFDNADNINVRGIETELEGAWQGGWSARLSYSYAETEDEATGDRLSNSPEHLAKLNLLAPILTDKIFLGFEVQALSERDTISGTHVSDHILCNVTLFSRELVKNLEASASLYNVFDKTFADPVSEDFVQDSINQPGRTFRVKITYRF